ncbi:MAG TPA: hypothetical protein H9680_01335 [Firmicutes bacterium]|nr:hypothetical protein [Bacillota bacterium]
MKKSVYSLVLMDEVVEAIDRMAYAMNTSRSSLINQVLADYASCVTPESRMKDIFSRVEELMQGVDTFQVQLQPSDAMLSIRSALRYKYKPTIRYSVELYRDARQVVGELRVTSRSQSQALLEVLDGFFHRWSQLEQGYLGPLFPGGQVPSQIGEGRFRRQFLLPREQDRQTNDQVAQAIAGYIRFFDRAMKVYFQESGDPAAAGAQLEQLYRSQLKKGITVI